MRHILARHLTAVITAAALFAPMTALAAVTPQQALNQAIKAVASFVPLRSDGEFNVNIKVNAFVKGKSSGTAHIHGFMWQRLLSRDGANTTGEGRVSIDKVEVVTNNPADALPFKWDGELALQWKVKDHMAYFRVEKIPPSLGALLATEGTNVDAVVGQWISFDLNNLSQSLPPTGPTLLLDQHIGNGKASADIKKITDLNPFLITRTEKVEQGADGQRIIRVRLMLNPRLITTFYNEALKNIAKDDPFRKDRIKSLNEQYANIRKVFAGMSFVAVVDQSAQTLKRFELGGRYVYPTKECSSFTRAGACIYRTTGNVDVRYSAGVSYRKDPNPVINIPTTALTVEQLMEKLTPPAPATTEPTPEPIALPTPSTRLKPVTAADHIRGNVNAMVTLIEYSDFECPFCLRHEDTLAQLLRDFPNDVRLVYRHFPLSFHPEAQKAAEASECAGRQGKFWEMHDKIFEANAAGEMSVQQWKDDAVALGLDSSTFNVCLDTGATADLITQSEQDGVDAEVNGTPATFVNGQLAEGALPYESFKLLVTQAGATH